MTESESKKLVNDYVEWLRRGLTVKEVEGAYELTTPFLDRHNDHLQIYAVKNNGKIEITDDGYILADLSASGLDINTPKRKAVFEAMLNGFGVRTDGKSLIVEASERNLGQRVHSLVQAMLAVNDTFMLAQPRVASYFYEDVQEFLNSNEIRYSPRVKLSGRSGFDHAIDFLIPRSRNKPERFLQTINAPTKSTIGSYLFALSDTRAARNEETIAYAFLNDQGRKIGGDIYEALDSYSVKPIMWSSRAEVAQELAA